MKSYAKEPPTPGPLNHYLIKQEKGVAKVHKAYEVLKDAVTQCMSSVKACESMELVWFVLSTARVLSDNQTVEPVPP